MDLFVNELSLHGQFSSISPFVAALKEVMSCRSVAERYRHPFYCPRAIAERETLHGATFKEVVRQTRDMNLIRVVMSWLDKHGPFWEEARTHSDREYFECVNTIVTDCSLGEAAFRMAQERTTATISFRESLFCLSPLRVVWHRSDDTQDAFDLPNFWEQSALETYLLERETAPRSWSELIEQVRMRYTALTFMDSILDPLNGEPFNTTIAEQVRVRLDILNRLKGCLNRDSALTDEGHQLIQNFFHGDRAYFSDESETNKRIFTKQLTFVTPTGEEIFCPYHGKINFRYYRIHHSWPIVPGQPLYVAYIGPKITKS